MHVINARNVHEALPEAIYQLARIGRQRQSRNGPVLVAPEPVTTLYQCPAERVLFWPERDANPFFHLFEALWMLGGRRDVAYVRQFAANMALYSDDGVNFHGAYGRRWRKAFNHDQIPLIAERLRRNRDDRRQVLQMWDSQLDLNVDQSNGKDYPCNLVAHFQVNEWGALDMTVFCRSNDIIWGCYGANAVHFSVLLEYVAARAGYPVGRYWQVSSNWHAYLKTFDPLKCLQVHAKDPYTCRLMSHSPYEEGEVKPFPLLADGEEHSMFDADLAMFLDEGGKAIGYRSPFIRHVALPMLQAWELFKDRGEAARFTRSIGHLMVACHASDWRRAGVEWLQRRERRHQIANDDGAHALEQT